MVDVSIIESGGTYYSVKSSLKEVSEDRYNFSILYVYEISGSPNGHSYQKKKTVFDSAEDGKFSQQRHKQLFKDITTYIGQKYHIKYLLV